MLRGRGRGGIVTMPDPEAITGLVFPSNGSPTVQFRFSGANLPNIVPLSLLFKYYPVQQTGYHATFFHGPGDGSFIASTTYFGCHPYPQGEPGSSGTSHKWEISIEGQDNVVDENGNDTTVTKDAWYSQAASSRDSGGSASIVDFYWDLVTSTNRRISHTTAFGALVNDPASPCLVFGDAPWNQTAECMSGRFRGLQIYNADVSAHFAALSAKETDAEVLAYCAANSITSAWYLNMNPTPTDISDKSGAGHDPAWFGANRPTLWEG